MFKLNILFQSLDHKNMGPIYPCRLKSSGMNESVSYYEQINCLLQNIQEKRFIHVEDNKVGQKLAHYTHHMM